MFGLLQRRTCSTDAAARNDYRLHYCGTCKTMGALYGQPSRMLLNFDAVFFAELLTNLSAQNSQNWNIAYQTQNCFALPTDETEMPASLRYAASANVLLAELKNDDNLRDGGGLLWRGAKWILSDAYQKASNTMQSFGLDIDAVWQEIEAQNRLETDKNIHAQQANATITEYAVPTKKMTALVFAQAAKNIDKPELFAQLSQVGNALGELVYFLDALEDLEKDAKDNTFNAFLAFFQTKRLNALQLDFASRTVKNAEINLAKALENLPLSAEIKEEMVARLSANLVLRTHKIVPTAASSAQVASMETLPQTMSAGETMKVATYSMIVLFLPQVSGAIGNGSKHNWSVAAMAAAVWAAIWAGKKAKQTCATHGNPTADCCDSNSCGNGGGGGADGCCTACLSACVAACCQSICNATCSICTETMCSSCRSRNDSSWTAFWVVIFCLVVLLGVAYLIIKLGVA